MLLSPSKTINNKNVHPNVPSTTPDFLDEANYLAKTLDARKDEIASIFGVSDKTAKQNQNRFANWCTDAKSPEAERAAWSYRGEVFFGLSAEKLSIDEIKYVNDHLRIVSGLYGLLRITDLILPYRLEMGTKLDGTWGSNLYDFWGDSLAKQLEKLDGNIVLNLSSKEYFKSIDKHISEDYKVISPKFVHKTKNGLKPKMAFAKYSRGLMARWVIVDQIDDIAKLKNFTEEGYRYDPELSTEDEPVYVAPGGFSIKDRFKKT